MAPVYQLRIDIIGAKPPIWRRLLVPSDITLEEMHRIIQEAFGWWDAHLHMFTKDGQRFSIPFEDDFMGASAEDERDVLLSDLLQKEEDTLRYTYDFGDNWEHTIKLEKIVQEENGPLPRCIKGKNACPPEDVGGLWGYYAMLDSLADPDDPEHEHWKGWVEGDSFDPTRFDLDEVNARLEQLRPQ